MESNPAQIAKLAAKLNGRHQAVRLVADHIDLFARDLGGQLSSYWRSAEPELLKIDMDSCDCRIAEALLQKGDVLPRLIFVGINPFWPPPLRLNCSSMYRGNVCSFRTKYFSRVFFAGLCCGSREKVSFIIRGVQQRFVYAC